MIFDTIDKNKFSLTLKVSLLLFKEIHAKSMKNNSENFNSKIFSYKRSLYLYSKNKTNKILRYSS